MLIVQISIAVLHKPEKSINSLFLKKTEDGTTVSFDIPFSLEEVRMYGKHYFNKRENRNKRLQIQGSRNIGCQAKLRSNPILHNYPDYVVPDTTVTSPQAKQAEQVLISCAKFCLDMLMFGGLGRKKKESIK